MGIGWCISGKRRHYCISLLYVQPTTLPIVFRVDFEETLIGEYLLFKMKNFLSKSTSAKKLQKKPGIIYNGEHKHGTKPCHRKKCILRGGSYKC